MKLLFGLLFSCLVIKSATAIKCYSCDATNTSIPFQCSEWFERYDTPDIIPDDCSSVFEAKYCVKHVGRFEVTSIKCYQCRSADTIYCSDGLINMDKDRNDAPIQPESCDHVIDAQYCIKSTALDGGIGAKRYCSSKNLGNYCDYVQNIGDQMEYRSCIYTCDSDGCNTGSNFKINSILLLGLLLGVFVHVL